MHSRRPNSQAVKSTGTHNYLIASASLLPCRHCNVTVTSLAGRQPLPHWPSRRPRGIFCHSDFLSLSLFSLYLRWLYRGQYASSPDHVHLATELELIVMSFVLLGACLSICAFSILPFTLLHPRPATPPPPRLLRQHCALFACAVVLCTQTRKARELQKVSRFNCKTCRVYLKQGYIRLWMRSKNRNTRDGK